MDWTQAELEDLDRKTRKLMTTNHALHPQSDVDRLYLPRQTGGRRLLQLKQTVEEEKRALNDYIKNSTENYLKEVTKEEIIKVQETKKEYHKQEIKTRKERWQGKALHGQYLMTFSLPFNADYFSCVISLCCNQFFISFFSILHLLEEKLLYHLIMSYLFVYMTNPLLFVAIN